MPWNYPIYLAAGPLVAALAAGNRVMIKMSELVPATGALLAALVAGSFARDEVCVVNGEAEVGRAGAIDRFAVGEEVIRGRGAQLGRAHDFFAGQEVDPRREVEVRIAVAHAFSLEPGHEFAPAGVRGDRTRKVGERGEGAERDEADEQETPTALAQEIGRGLLGTWGSA